MDKLNSAIHNKFKAGLEYLEIFLFSAAFIYKTYSTFYLDTFQMLSELYTSSVIIAILSGQLAADFISGVFHWALDTWGTVDVPFIGSVIGEFREHHIDPSAMTLKPSRDTNGNNFGMALIGLCMMHCCQSIGLFKTALAIYSFAVGVALTNQFHKWSHLPGYKLPAIVRILQKSGIILSFQHHHKHHVEHLSHYCITNGWMNEPLEMVNFWRNAEWLVSKVTGAVPREDEYEWFDKTSKDHKTKKE